MLEAVLHVCDPVKVPVSVLCDLDQCRFQAATLRRENQRLRQENERLRQENASLQQQLEQLQAELEQARRQAKRQSAPFSKGPPKTNPKRPGRKAGTAHGRHGHRLPPSPEHIDESYEAPLPATCPDCGGSVRETEVVAQFQTEIPRRPIFRQFHVHVGRCCHCGRRLQGRHPLQTSEALGAAASQVGPEAQAAVVILNKTAGLSHAKVAQVFRSLFGIELTRGASAQIMQRAARRLEPAYEEVRQELKASPGVTPDETGWRVGGQPAWLHAWVAERATMYAIDRKRSADALEAVIGRNYAGCMTHDGMASYDRFRQATHQQCVGHVLRRVRELEAKATGGAVHYPRALIQLFTAAIHLRNQYVAGQVSAGRLRAARCEFEARLWHLVKARRVVPAYETLSHHLWYYLSDWFTFLDHPEVEPTNAAVERAIRPAVVNRKVWGGNRTWRGAKAQEILMSVLETRKRAGRPALDFISESLRAFGNSALARPILLPPR